VGTSWLTNACSLNLVLFVRLWLSTYGHLNYLGQREPQRVPPSYEIGLLREKLEQVLIDGLLSGTSGITLQLHDQASRTEMDGRSRFSQFIKHRRNINGACEVFNILLSFLQVEQVKSSLMLAETQHLLIITLII
jgi:hypothetical protein